MKLALNELSLENLSDWPLAVKVGVAVLVAVLMLFLGYWFDTKNQLKALQRAEQKEEELRLEFATKQQLAANFAAYQEQLKIIEHRFGQMVRELPAGAEVPALLEAISETGIASGLTFELFKPLPEIKRDFYAELPIEMKVIGRYHQLATFISRVAALDRIVTIHDLKIEHVRAKNNKDAAAKDELSMFVIAKTYRYLDEAEIQS